MAVFVFKNFHYLSVNDNRAADNAEDRKYGYKYPFNAEPFVYLKSDIETKTNATDHGKAQLHDDLHIFRPGPVFFIIK